MNEKLKKIAEALTGDTPHPDYTDTEESVKCRDCKCRVHLGTATKAAGFETNGEYLCRLCNKYYE